MFSANFAVSNSKKNEFIKMRELYGLLSNL